MAECFAWTCVGVSAFSCSKTMQNTNLEFFGHLVKRRPALKAGSLGGGRSQATGGGPGQWCLDILEDQATIFFKEVTNLWRGRRTKKRGRTKKTKKKKRDEL